MSDPTPPPVDPTTHVAPTTPVSPTGPALQASPVTSANSGELVAITYPVVPASAALPFDAPVVPSGESPFGMPPAGGSPFGLRAPTEPRKSRRLVVGISIAAACVLVLGGGIAVGAAVVTASLSPKKQVEAFLQNLVDGNAEDALALSSRSDYGDAGVLLTDKAYAAATNHINAFTVAEPVISGGKATVVAKITQGIDTYTQKFALKTAGKTLLFFDTWQLAAIPFGTFAVSLSGPSDLALTVNGATFVPKNSTGRALPAFPGDYTAEAPATSTNYLVVGDTATVAGFGDHASVSMRAGLSKTGKEVANAALSTWLNACAAQAVLVPVDCGFGIDSDAGSVYTNVAWVVTRVPISEFGPWDGKRFPVTNVTTGKLDMTADYSMPATGEYGDAWGSADDYGFFGDLTFVNDVATYVSRVTLTGVTA